MAEQFDNKFSNRMREVFEDFEPEYSHQDWKNLKSRMNHKGGRKRAFVIIAVAASCLFAMNTVSVMELGSDFEFQNNESNHEVAVAHDNSHTATAEEKNTAFTDKYENKVFANAEEFNTIIDVDSSGATPDVKIEYPSDDVASTEKKSFNISSNKYMEAINLLGKDDVDNIGLSLKLPMSLDKGKKLQFRMGTGQHFYQDMSNYSEQNIVVYNDVTTVSVVDGPSLLSPDFSNGGGIDIMSTSSTDFGSPTITSNTFRVKEVYKRRTYPIQYFQTLNMNFEIRLKRGLEFDPYITLPLTSEPVYNYSRYFTGGLQLKLDIP